MAAQTNLTIQLAIFLNRSFSTEKQATKLASEAIATSCTNNSRNQRIRMLESVEYLWLSTNALLKNRPENRPIAMKKPACVGHFEDKQAVESPSNMLVQLMAAPVFLSILGNSKEQSCC